MFKVIYHGKNGASCNTNNAGGQNGKKRYCADIFQRFDQQSEIVRADIKYICDFNKHTKQHHKYHARRKVDQTGYPNLVCALICFDTVTNCVDGEDQAGIEECKDGFTSEERRVNDKQSKITDYDCHQQLDAGRIKGKFIGRRCSNIVFSGILAWPKISVILRSLICAYDFVCNQGRNR